MRSICDPFRLLSMHHPDETLDLPQDRMQDVEVVKFAELLNLREERAKSLWMSPFRDIMVD